MKNTMYLINQYANVEEAYIDKGFLESNGIPAEVDSSAMSEIFPAPGAGTGSVSLYVPNDRAQEAIKLMDDRA